MSPSSRQTPNKSHAFSFDQSSNRAPKGISQTMTFSIDSLLLSTNCIPLGRCIQAHQMHIEPYYILANSTGQNHNAGSKNDALRFMHSPVPSSRASTIEPSLRRSAYTTEPTSKHFETAFKHCRWPFCPTKLY
jgi:hypothetical protein